MVRNHKLAKSISDVGWERFSTMLCYKAKMAGKVYLEVGRFFPSSKTCNNCLYQIGEMPLDIRNWVCPRCNTNHDRDINAAKNIRDEGLRILLSEGTFDTASGGDVRRLGRPRKLSNAIPETLSAVGRVCAPNFIYRTSKLDMRIPADSRLRKDWKPRPLQVAGTFILKKVT